MSHADASRTVGNLDALPVNNERFCGRGFVGTGFVPMNRNGSALATLEASIAEKARAEQERRDRLWQEQALERKQQQRVQNGKESFSVFQRTMLNKKFMTGADVPP